MFTGPSGKRFDRLLENAHRLAQLLHAHEEAIVHVAVRPDRHLEVVGLVIEIREILAHVVVDARRAKHRPRKSPVDRFLRRHDAESDGAPHPDRVPGQHAVDLVERVREGADELAEPVHPSARNVGRHSADSRRGRREPRANPALEQVVDVLAFLERPQERRERPDVDAERAEPDEVRHDARQLGRDDAQNLAPLRDLDPNSRSAPSANATLLPMELR